MASDTLQNGKFFVAVFFGSHAKGSRAELLTKKRKKKMVMRDDNMESIWDKIRIKMNVGVCLTSYGMEGTIYIDEVVTFANATI